MRISDSLAESLLRQSGAFSEEQLADLRSQSLETKRPVQDIIVQNGLLSEAELTSLYAHELNLPFVELPASGINHEFLNLLPEHVAARYKAVVFDIDNGDDSVLVAMEDPNDKEALSFLQKQLGDNLRFHVTTTSHLKAVLDQYRDRRGDELLNEQAVPHKNSSAVSKESAAESVKLIIERAVQSGASDIHIEPHIDYVIIRYRIDGLLHEAHKLPIEALAPVVGYIKSIGQMKPGEHHTPQYGQWNIVMGDQHYVLRISVLPTIDGEKVALHIVPHSGEPPSLRALGLWGSALHDLQKAIVQPHGIICITGPIGSGKSVSLFSLLSVLNTPNVNIATIEDPLEYRIAGANQVQVNPSAGVTMVSGLEGILSQDPNVIMVSEIRDNAVAKMAVQASQKGHLVLSTLHTASAPAGVRRLLDMEVEPFLVASSLRAVVGQRLPRRLCVHCREAIKPDSATLKRLEKSTHLADYGGFRRLHELETQALEEGMGVSQSKSASDANDLSSSVRGISRLWKAHEGGCEACQHTGYHGRVGIFEVLVSSTELQTVITHSSSEKVISKAAREAGMISMQIDGLVKALRGQTTLAEVLRVTAHG